VTFDFGAFEAAEDVLRAVRYNYSSEEELQAAVADRLGARFEREARLSNSERIDFFDPSSGIGVEVKVAGSRAVVLRQLFRYAGRPEIGGLILVTGRARLLHMPSTIHGKPVISIFVGAGL
jgi:hypothetical protein